MRKSLIVRHWLGALFFFLTLSCLSDAAAASAFGINDPLCHAVTIDTASPPPANAYHCEGEPVGYQTGTLWLRADVRAIEKLGSDPVILLHHTRFDRLTVAFTYPDGFTDVQRVERGDYGEHWRIGGQIEIDAPHRNVAPTQVTIALHHLTSDRLFRARILDRVTANRDLAVLALLSCGAIALLLISGIYNFSLAIAVRRQFLIWHSLWAACMMLWGLLWSQIALIAMPSLAGTAAAQTCTFLACLAVTMATISVATALKDTVPRWAQRGLIAVGISVALLGVPAALALGRSIETISPLLSSLCLADLLAVVIALAWSWRRGSGEARDLAKSWALPMAALALTQVFDLNEGLFGGGAQMAVLIASALQTVLLSTNATLRFSLMRVELDQSRAAESALAELANRDPLTGLFNRRGFVDCLQATFAGGNDAPLALLLMDIDLFKSVNDRFGHEAGDAVLCRIAASLRQLERELCVAGRMGGEEFVVAVSGLTSLALAQFAESVRARISALDHGLISKSRPITVSIGVMEGSTRTAFQRLYSGADRALYDAKRAGRNKVMFASGLPDLQSREQQERDQLSFRWPQERR